MPGDHLERIEHKPGTKRASTRRPPGSISHKPGTSEPGRNLERISHDQGQNKRARGRNSTHHQADRCQGHTWSASSISQERASQGDHLEKSDRPTPPRHTLATMPHRTTKTANNQLFKQSVKNFVKTLLKKILQRLCPTLKQVFYLSWVTESL